jgi:hypothetical protein
MRTLFVYPEFPTTFWSYEKILELVNRKVLLPPWGWSSWQHFSLRNGR